MLVLLLRYWRCVIVNQKWDFHWVLMFVYDVLCLIQVTSATGPVEFYVLELFIV